MHCRYFDTTQKGSHQQWLVGNALLHLKFALEVTNYLRKHWLWQISQSYTSSHKITILEHASGGLYAIAELLVTNSFQTFTMSIFGKSSLDKLIQQHIVVSKVKSHSQLPENFVRNASWSNSCKWHGSCCSLFLKSYKHYRSIAGKCLVSSCKYSLMTLARLQLSTSLKELFTCLSAYRSGLLNTWIICQLVLYSLLIFNCFWSWRFPLFTAIHHVCIGKLAPEAFIDCLKDHPEHV